MISESRSTILAIDDEPFILEGISTYFEDSGHNVLQAENGRNGLEVFRRENPDIILVDLRMPEVDGLEVLTTVTRESPGTPIIVVSGTGVIADAIEALRQGAWDYVLKPLHDMEVMEHAVNRALERARLLKENQKYQEHLENEIKKRTAELSQLNAQLQTELEERKKAEERMRLLSSAVEQSTEGIAVVDLTGNLLFLNDAFAGMHGYTADELIGMNLSIFHTPEQMPAVDAANRQIKQAGEFSGEIWHVRRDGTVFPTLMHNSLLRDDAGDAIGMIGTLRDMTNLKRAEETLRVSEEKFSKAFHSSAALMAIGTMEEGRYLEVNESFLKTTGFDRKEVIGKTSRELNIFANYSQKDKILETIKKKGSGKDFELVIRTKDGNSRHGIFSAHIFKMREQEYLLTVMNDITDRKRAEEETLEWKNRYEATILASGHLLYDWDSETNEVTYGGNIEKILGYSKEEMERGLSHWIDLVHPEDQDYFEKEIEHLIETKGSAHLQYRVRRKDGKYIFVEDEGYFIADALGNEIRMVGFVKDITERKRSEEALKETSARLQLALKSSNIGLWDWNLHTNEVYFSPEWKSQIGFEDHEIQGHYQEWESRLHPEDRDRTLMILADYLNGRRNDYVVEFRLRHKDASYRWILAQGEIMPDADGNQSRMMGGHIDITERKQAEEALLFKNTLLVTQQEASPDGILVVDESGKMISFNQRFVDMWEIPDDVVASRSDERALQSVLDKLVEPEEFLMRVRFLYQHPHEKSHEEISLTGGKTFERYSSPMFDDDGKYYGRVWYFLDITERKRTEAALKNSERSYREIFHNSRDAIFVLDAETGDIVDINKTACDFFGYSPDEMKALIIEDLSINIPPYTQREAFQWIKKAKEEGPQSFEWLSKKKNGKLIWFEDVILNARIAGKERILVFGRDITERRQYEEKLKDAYDIISKSPAVAFLRKNEEGWPVEFVSPNVETVFGYTEEEFTSGKVAYSKTVHPDDLKKISEEIALYSMQKRRMHFKHEPYRIVTKEGEVKWIDDRTFIRRDDQGRITHYQGIVEDVTDKIIAHEEKTNLEKQLQQAQKMEALGTLAGGVAHDFNNILGGIIGYTELAQESVPGDWPAHRDLEKVLDASSRAKELVDHILAFSRQSKTELKPLRISIIAKEASKLLRASLPTTIEIRRNIEAESEIVKADPTQIHQLVMNLCTNAGHAMRDTGGVLEVKLTAVAISETEAAAKPDLHSGPYIKLTISDTGHGMAPDVLERIFDPYFTTKEKGEGTGLGLAVVHGIVKSHGGAITVDSELGTGTTFRIYLPRIEDTEDRVLKKAQLGSLPTGHEHILIVDDEQNLVDIGKRTLESLGYKVDARINSIEALELFRNASNRFDLVITDQTMPNMTGSELAVELMKIRPDIPIILCTGFSELASEEKAKEMGIRGFINKPVVKREIAKTIREVLDK